MSYLAKETEAALGLLSIVTAAAAVVVSLIGWAVFLVGAEAAMGSGGNWGHELEDGIMGSVVLGVVSLVMAILGAVFGIVGLVRPKDAKASKHLCAWGLGLNAAGLPLVWGVEWLLFFFAISVLLG